jgi:hypothetical protein
MPAASSHSDYQQTSKQSVMWACVPGARKVGPASPHHGEVWSALLLLPAVGLLGDDDGVAAWPASTCNPWPLAVTEILTMPVPDVLLASCQQHRSSLVKLCCSSPDLQDVQPHCNSMQSAQLQCTQSSWG